MVGDAKSWLNVWPAVEEILTNRYVGIYNAEFDLKMIMQSHRLNGMPWRAPTSEFFCVMDLYSDFYGSKKWQRLEAAGRQCGISLPNSHRARDDALLTRSIFIYMVNGGR
jgi:DNA polymerase-3 subunit epsilon